MDTASDQSRSVEHPQTPVIAFAWTITLLVSSLGDILLFELTGAVPIWLLWVKASLLGVLILLGWFWKPIKALGPFFILLLAIMSLMWVKTWLLDSSAWTVWQNQQSFTVVSLTAQLVEAGVALSLIVLLFLLRKRRQRFFLVMGNMNAKAEPVKWLGQKSSGSLWSFGLVFSLVVIVGQFFMFIFPLSPTSDTFSHLMPLIPVILLLAASNGVTEEIIYRVAPISPVYEVVGKGNAIWMAAVLFGLSHYIGGSPAGIPGVLITAFLGWFFGKCLLDSKGFFWPWLFHSLQDILPFTLMALAAIS